MAEFKEAFEQMMNNEDRLRKGTITCDSGGVTKYGISFNFLKHTTLEDADFNHDGQITADDVRVMTFEECEPLYRKYFWNPVKGDEIQSQQIANKVLDMAVNMGVPQATILLQRALHSLGADVFDDGKFGSKTLAAVNAADSDLLLNGVKQFAIAFYKHIAEIRDVSLDEFTSWMRRAVA